MALSAGTRLGPYEILEPLGAGGMGEVYRAHDPKLSRDVAVKVLPGELAEDPERLARFQREATLLAALNHPNIAAIHGLEEGDGSPFLVLELVEGENLAERLTRGAIPVDEALEIARQITEALEEAHEKGIVHRDLKPANVKLTPDGKVKVLDFGLAKAYAGDAGPGGVASDFTRSPTLAQSGTAAGVILGTASYMSPEQASGKPVDKRADIWAFGAVLFEMLTGRRLFTGETVSEVLASVIKDEPDWSGLPAATPPALRRLLRRCLEKNPQRRLHDIADAGLEIDETLHQPVEPSPAAGSHADRARPQLAWVIAALAIVIALAAAWAAWRHRPPATVKHVAVNLPPGYRLARVGDPSFELALSPDGNLLVFTAQGASEPQLFLRALDRLEVTPLPGTEGGQAPFFSPDGEWVGFFARDGTLQKVSVAGGTPVVICDPDARSAPGASWGPDDTIIFSPENFDTGGLWRVSAAGGAPDKLADRVRWPQILPGGKHLLATARPENEDLRPVVMSLETTELHSLERGRGGARYVPSGHLVYGQAGSLMAVGFDLHQLALRGSPRPVLDNVYMHPYDLAYFTFSETGTLVYVPGRNETTLEWVDRDGRGTPATTAPGDMMSPRVAPDGRRIAVSRLGMGVWVYDAVRGTGTRLETGRPLAWTGGGERVVLARDGISWQPADGSGPPEPLPTGTPRESPKRASNSSLPDVPRVVVGRREDVWALSPKGDLIPVVATPSDDRHPALSPDGSWLAYSSNETGRFEVYVQRYPGGAQKRIVSTDGGVAPVWSPEGRELFYRVASGDKVMSVSFGRGSLRDTGIPRLLFEGDYYADSKFRNYDIAPDGQRFLMMKKPPVRTLNVVVNWSEELKQKMREVGQTTERGSP